MNDLDYMKMAYHLALKGKATVSPNPMVGAVIVKNGKVIAKGFHHHRGGPHAEIVAINNAKVDLKDSKMYVTLEPCFHFGRTPPCVDAILKAQIKEVVIGMIDPNPKTCGRSIAKLRSAGVRITVGILHDELTVMNESFIKYIKHQMPFVVAKTAQTLDGKIATAKGESKWITSEASRKFAHGLRNDFDAILVGINTVLADDPGLNASYKSIKKIIVDSTLRLPLKAKLFKKTDPKDCFIATTKKADKKKVAFLAKQGVHVIVCPDKKGKVDLKWLMKDLAKREITKMLIEGGAQMVGAALQEKLVDKMMVFIAPKIIGDQNALSSVVGFGALRLKDAIELRDIKSRRIGEDLLIEGYIK